MLKQALLGMGTTKMERFTVISRRGCEISFIELRTKSGKKFKVTKRLPEMSVANTRIFGSRYEALKQFYEWLE